MTRPTPRDVVVPWCAGARCCCRRLRRNDCHRNDELSRRAAVQQHLPAGGVPAAEAHLEGLQRAKLHLSPPCRHQHRRRAAALRRCFPAGRQQDHRRSYGSPQCHVPGPAEPGAGARQALGGGVGALQNGRGVPVERLAGERLPSISLFFTPLSLYLLRLLLKFPSPCQPLDEKYTTSAFASAFSGGLWWDPAAEIYKMWYRCGGAQCYATSLDGSYLHIKNDEFYI